MPRSGVSLEEFAREMGGRSSSRSSARSTNSKRSHESRKKNRSQSQASSRRDDESEGIRTNRSVSSMGSFLSGPSYGGPDSGETSIKQSSHAEISLPPLKFNHDGSQARNTMSSFEWLNKGPNLPSVERSAGSAPSSGWNNLQPLPRPRTWGGDKTQQDVFAFANASARSSDPAPSDPASWDGVMLEKVYMLLKTVYSYPLELDLWATLDFMAIQAAKVCNCERATIFVIDVEARQLWMPGSDKHNPLRFPLNVGIVGYCASTGEVVGLEDPAQDDRFIADVDAFACDDGRLPITALTVPMADSVGQPVAVFQLVNKKGREQFTREDVALMSILGLQAGGAIRLCLQRYEQGLGKREGAELKEVSLRLLRLTNLLLCCETMDGTCKLARRHVVELLGGDCECNVYLCEESEAERSANEIKMKSWLSSEVAAGCEDPEPIPMALGPATTAGLVALNNTVLLVPNVYTDDRFAAHHPRPPHIPEGEPVPPRSLLCVPVRGPMREVIAVIEILSGEAPLIPPAATNDHASSGGGGADDEDDDGGPAQAEYATYGPNEETIVVSYAGFFSAAVRNTEAKAIAKETQDIINEMSRDIELPASTARVAGCTAKLLAAECCLVFIADRDRQELWCRVNNTTLRYGLGEGLVGAVAETGSVVNIADTATDSRWLALHAKTTSASTPVGVLLDASGEMVGEPAPSWETTLGSKTKSVLCTPVYHAATGTMTAVLAVINKQIVTPSGIQIGEFSIKDEGLLSRICEYAGDCLERATVFDRVSQTVLRNKQMMHAGTSVMTQYDINLLLVDLRGCAKDLLQAPYCTVYFLDRKSNQMWTRFADGKEIKLPITNGIAGQVVSDGHTILIHDVREDDRFDPNVESLANLDIRSALAVPVFNAKNEVVGVMQLMHTQIRAFSDQDQELLSQFCAFAGVAVDHCIAISKKYGQVQRGISNANGLDSVYDHVCDSISEMLHCQRALLYVLETEHNMLVCRVNGVRKQLAPGVGQGIVGHVVSSLQTVRVDLVALDPRFRPDIDLPSGEEGRSVLCVPLLDTVGNFVGVIMAVNKKRGGFTFDDEVLLRSVSSQFGEIIMNALRYDKAMLANTMHRKLLSFTQHLFVKSDLHSLLRLANSQVKDLINVEHSSVYMVDHYNNILWTVSKEDIENPEIRFPLSTDTIAGAVAASGDALNIPDVAADARFNVHAQQSGSGDAACSILCVPIMNIDDDRAIGVIEVINKQDSAFIDFSAQDEAALTGYASQLALAMKRVEQMQRTIKTVQMINGFQQVSLHLDLDLAVQAITKSVCQIMNVERATVFIVDHDKMELWSRIQPSGFVLRFPVGTGIAGHVAESGQTLCIPDAYQSPLFSAAFDKKTGFRTHNILCMACFDFNGNMVGVIQAINKNKGQGVFGVEDEDFLRIFGTQAGIVLKNNVYFDNVIRNSKKQQLLMEMLADLLKVSDIEIFKLVEKQGIALMECRRCTLYVKDREKQELWTVGKGMRERVVVEIDVDATCATGQVAISCETLFIDFDKDGIMIGGNSSGYSSCLLGVPVKNANQEVIGVIEAVNRRGGVFDEVDSQLLNLYASVAATAIQRCHDALDAETEKYSRSKLPPEEEAWKKRPEPSQ